MDDSDLLTELSHTPLNLLNQVACVIELGSDCVPELGDDWDAAHADVVCKLKQVRNYIQNYTDLCDKGLMMALNTFSWSMTLSTNPGVTNISDDLFVVYFTPKQLSNNMKSYKLFMEGMWDNLANKGSYLFYQSAIEATYDFIFQLVRNSNQ